ncbi:MAG: hypothetical protein ACR2MA_09800 [Egibacteraceae bacterium]
MSVWQSVTLGAVTGSRSMMGPAFVAGRLSHSRMVGVGTRLLATGELVADKLPDTPSRLAKGPLAGRAVMGGIAGAAMSRPRAIGFALGATGAVAGAYGLFHARRLAGERSELPDAALGLLEDGVVIGLGRLATRS